MAVKINPETGHMGIVGTDSEKTKVIPVREVYKVFSGREGERLMNDITQDCLNRGQRVPLAIKAVKNVHDIETKETISALDNVEQLRKGRLQREKMAGRLSESQYETEIQKGVVA